MRTEAEMRHYQWWMRKKIVELLYVALWAEQGLGKTVATLFAMKDLIESGEVKTWLVVAPLLVAETTWPDEIAEWKELRALRYSVVTGSEKERIQALMSSAPIKIINRENLIWLHQYLKGNFPFEGLVYDEASRLKSGQVRTKPSFERLKTEIADLVVEGQRIARDNNDPWRDLLDNYGYKLLGEPFEVRQALANVDRQIMAKQREMKPKITEYGVVNKMRDTLKAVIQLTGTPTPQGLIDLWGPIYILDRGVRLHTSKNQYITRYFDVNRYSRKITPRPGSLELVTEKLKDIAFSLRSDDYLTLPDRIDNIVKVKLPAKAMEQYRELEREFVLEEHDIEAVNQGVLTCKLLQLCNGSIYKGEDKEIIEIHDAKLDALEMLIEGAQGKPVLVAYEFQFDLLKIKKRFPKAVILNQESDVVKKWNAGKIQLLLTHPASAAYGLNMQHGGNITVWYGLTWSLELYQQLNKRLHRSGQKNAVVIHHILAEGTFDERQYKALSVKGATQDSVTDAVRVTLPA